MNEKKAAMLREKAHEIRKYTLTSIGKLGVGHIGGSLSLPEVLAVLYFDVMNMTDTRYFDFGGLEMPGVWFSGGIVVTIG